MDPALIPPALDIHGLLRRYGLSPKKGMGQNFLVDPAALARIVSAAELPPDGSVLEIGPGLGSLTRYLARAAKQVVAVELDSHLIPALQEVLADYGNVQVVQGDILDLDPARLMPHDGYQVVANIPYYITSAIIRHLLEAEVQPDRLVLTMQREVAERICAEAGEMSLLALSVQIYGQPRIAARIPAGAFYPVPNVDSITLRVDLYPQPRIPRQQIDAFFQLCKAGFSQKRKTLRNSLSGGMRLTPAQAESLLAAAGIDPMRRAETLTIDEWSALVESFVKSE